MRSALLLLLLSCLPCLVQAAEWWRVSDRSLPGLLDDGYVVVGFSALPTPGPTGGHIDRTLLQNGASLYRCEEARSADGRTLGQACYELVPVGEPPLEKVDRPGD